MRKMQFLSNKATRQLCRLITMLVVVFLAVGQHEAQARWSVAYKIQGGFFNKTPARQLGFNPQNIWDHGTVPDNQGLVYGIGDDSNAITFSRYADAWWAKYASQPSRDSYKVSLSITPILIWQDSDGNLPPDTVAVIVHSYALSNASKPTNVSASTSADNGLKSEPYEQNADYFSSASSDGYEIIQRSVPSDSSTNPIVVPLKTITASCNFETTWGPYQAGGGEVTISMSVGFAEISQPQPYGYRSNVLTPVLSVVGEPLPEDPILQPPVNQYVMSGVGQQPFSIPAVISLSGQGAVDEDVVEDARQNSKWDNDRDLPNSLPKIANGKSGADSIYENGGSVFPQFHSDAPNPPSEPLPGLGYSTTSGLPASNSDFGVRWIKHTLKDNELGKSKIAVFYDPSAVTHSNLQGPPVGYEGSIDGHNNTYINTPNWFHYYSQAYEAPCEVVYLDDDSINGVFINSSNDSDHIHLGNGIGMALRDGRTKSTWLFGTSPGDRQVHEVGVEESRGIDMYARVIAHEYAHKRCYDAISGGALDTDQDSVPDAWESRLGLMVNPENGDTFNFVENHPELPYESAEGDREVFARMNERGVQGGSADNDWAVGGLNWGAVAPPNRAHRIKITLNDPSLNPDDITYAPLP